MSIATRVPDENEGIAHVLAIADRIFVRMGCMKIVPVQKLMSILFALLFFVTPLYMSARTSELFEFNKMLVIYLITGCALSLWVAHMLVSRKLIFQKNILLFPIGFFLLSHIASTLTSIDTHTSWFGYYGRFNGGLLSICAYIALFFLALIYTSRKTSSSTLHQIEKTLHISMIASACVMLWGLPSHFGYDLSCLLFSGSLDVACWTEQFKPTIRIFSTLGQPNWLGAYLVIHLIIGVYFFAREKVSRMKLIYGGYLLLTWMMILFTRSRSAYLALIVSGVLAGVSMLINRSHFHIKADRISKSIGVLAVVALVITGTGSASIDKYIHLPSVFQSKSSLPQKEANSDPTPAVSSITDSGSIRKIVWQGAFGLGLEYPLFGTGVETFAYSYSFVRPLEHNLTSEWDFVYNKAHNEYFNYLATTGLVGLLAYLIMIAVVLMHLRGVLQGSLSQHQSHMILMLECAYVSILVTNFFGFSTSTINIFFYIIPAWILLTQYGETFAQWSKDVLVSEKDSVILLLPIFMMLASLWFVIGYSRADRAYAQGDALVTAGSYSEAIPYLYKAYGLRNEHVYADKLSQVISQGALQEAQQEGSSPCVSDKGLPESCIDLSNTFSARAQKGSPYNIGYIRSYARNNFTFYQATKDEKYFTEAIASLDRARALAPTDPKLPYLRGLFALGKFETISKPTKKDRDSLELVGLPSIDFALKLKPNYSDAYYVKGIIQKSLKDTEGARKTFNYLLEKIDPNYEQARQELKTL